jgi:hypothetical protein
MIVGMPQWNERDSFGEVRAIHVSGQAKVHDQDVWFDTARVQQYQRFFGRCRALHVVAFELEQLGN